MKKKSSRKRIKPAEFKRIKQMFAFGLSKKIISSLTNRSPSTLWLIKKSEDFNHYRQIVQGLRKPKEENTNGLEERLVKLKADVDRLITEFIQNEKRKA